MPSDERVVGGYLLRLPRGFPGKIHIYPPSGEGGSFHLADFEREVCPWSELGEGMGERVVDFYRRNF